MAETLILLVEDDPVQRRLLETAITRSGMTVVTAPGGQPALDLINGVRGDQITLMLLDLVMPDMGGIEVLGKLRATNADLPVIVLTAKGGIDSAVEAMRAGANDFLVKPASPERIAVSIRNQLKIGTLSGEVKQLKKKTDNRLTFDDLIAEAPEMKQVFRLGARAAQSDIPILIEGESGAGKELIARAIHGRSPRFNMPFIKFNSAAIPRELVESELFGYEKGAFTGAVKNKRGKLEEADGGTLFLDEIGEIDPSIQAKLLRVLETGSFRRLGGTRDLQANIRVVAATNRDLAKLSEEGSFRPDLYYRLSAFVIDTPPLRERRDDIPYLVNHFIRNHNFSRRINKSISAEAIRKLISYDWPGNVRELKNVIERAIILSRDSNLIRPEHLAFANRANIKFSLKFDHDPTLEELELEYLRHLFSKYMGHRSKVAEVMNVSERSIYRFIRKYGLEDA